MPRPRDRAARDYRPELQASSRTSTSELEGENFKSRTNSTTAQDIWKGNIYKGVPSELVTRQKKTRNGREMTLIPLDQPNLKLEFTIKNKECLDLMRELTTQD